MLHGFLSESWGTLVPRRPAAALPPLQAGLHWMNIKLYARADALLTDEPKLSVELAVEAEGIRYPSSSSSGSWTTEFSLVVFDMHLILLLISCF